MRLRLTTDTFKEKAKAVHMGRYSYEKSVFVKTEEKVVITCKIHGDFNQSPKTHLKGSGCSSCTRVRGSEYKNMTSAKVFVEKAGSIHKNFYDYSGVKYIKSNQKVVISCPTHGDFFQSPNSHLAGNGCRKCGSTRVGVVCKKTTEEFIMDAKNVHGTRYDYSKSKYIDRKTSISVICDVHGIFETNPGNHVNGSGCPSCANYGFRVNLPASLYILQADDVLKVGITNKSVKARASQISKGSGKYVFKEVASWTFTSGKDAYDLEQKLHKYLSSKYLHIKDQFNGSTECFYDVDIDNLQSVVAQYLTKYKCHSIIRL